MAVGRPRHPGGRKVVVYLTSGCTDLDGELWASVGGSVTSWRGAGGAGFILDGEGPSGLSHLGRTGSHLAPS